MDIGNAMLSSSQGPRHPTGFFGARASHSETRSTAATQHQDFAPTPDSSSQTQLGQGQGRTTLQALAGDVRWDVSAWVCLMRHLVGANPPGLRRARINH